MNLQGIKNRIRKILAYTFAGLVFLVISVFLIIQIPPVQQAIINQVASKFNRITGFDATIKSFRMLWFDHLELKDVTIYDPDKNKMIAAGDILVNFKLFDIVGNADVNIDGVVVDNAEVYLTKIDATDTTRYLNINVFIDRINHHFASTTKTNRRTPRIKIGEAIVTNSKFSYINQDQKPVERGFNYHQFTTLVDEGQLSNFLILGDTTQFNLSTLIASDQGTGFNIHELSTFFRISQAGMEFTGVNLRAGESYISDTVLFRYSRMIDMADWVDKVHMHGHLVNTRIQPKDLALFAPFADRLGNGLINISGELNGKSNRFKVNDMSLDKGTTSLRGEIEIEGLPDLDETFINLNLKQSTLLFEDLSFLFNDQTLARLRPLGKLSMNGQFIGFTNDFVAKGDFVSGVGHIRSDINFKVNADDFDRSMYSGSLSLVDFDLGTYLKDTVMFQHIDLSGKVVGRGLTKQTADFTLNGKVNTVGIYGYDYTNIVTNARLSSQFFSGSVKINDPNLEFDLNGSLDFRKGRDILKVQGKLDTAMLHNLHLSQKPIFLHSKIDLNMNGLHLDSLDGTANLQDFKINYDDEWLELASIHLSAQKTTQGRLINLNSTYVDAKLEGNFYPSDIRNDIRTLYKEIMLNIENDKAEISSYYKNNVSSSKKYGFQFDFLLKDIEPVMNLVDIDLTLTDNTHIEGKFSGGYTTIFQAYAKVDSIVYKKNLFVNTEFDLTASKIADSTSVLSNFFVSSQNQKLGNLKTKDLLIEGIWNNNHIDFTLDADEQRQNNYVRMKGGIDFLKDSTELRILPSVVHLLDKDWQFDEKNRVVILGSNIHVYDLKLNNEDQSVLLSGKISENPEEILSTTITNFDISVLNAFLQEKISGELDAKVDLSNYYNDPFVQNDLFLKDFKVDDFLIGDITGKNMWDTLSNKFVINLNVDRLNERILDAEGSYDPSSTSSPLNVDAKLSNANVDIIEPFLNDFFSQWGGYVTGECHVTGTLAHPILNGKGEVSDGQVMINYLKTVYKFTGTVGLSPNSIFFQNMDLTDAFKNKATLDGTITHENFKNMRINMDASYKNFQVLNTTARDNSLFYGQGYASGDLNFFGPLSNLKITANARTDKNTKIFIPIGGTSSNERKEFINFVNFNDSTFKETLKKSVTKARELTGLTFDFNLDVTPDAYCEIILDMKAGDIIRGRGNGDIQLELDTKGDFRMYGPFEFTQGGYNFTLYDIINKDFEIKKGSRITWYGDPYRGVLSASASYHQLASFGPIISDQTLSATPQLRRKYPVEVLLKLEGPMLSPQLNFDIVANNIPQSIIVDGQTVRLAFEFQAFKDKLDEQELNRQVFSLIILRRFSPADAFNTSGSIVNSVSEFLSNQLSNWITQVDENLEIDVDLGTMDAEAFNTFQLRLSYSFFNGRLRITRDGTFYSNQNNTTGTSNSQSNLSGLAGDWTVDYLLTADGKFRAKMYNRTNVNPILNNLGTQNSMTTGASLMHTQSFNEFRDLIRRTRDKNRKQEGEEEQKEEEPQKEKETRLNKEAINNKNDDEIE
jgi:hypothetical protein